MRQEPKIKESWYQRNKETKAREYYEKNKERIKERKRKYREENKEKIKAYMNKWHFKNLRLIPQNENCSKKANLDIDLIKKNNILHLLPKGIKIDE